MKFLVDDVEVYELLDWHKTLIKNDIPDEIFEADMCRRCIYSLDAPIEKLVHVNKEKLKNTLRQVGVTSIPGDIKALSDAIGKRNDIGLPTLSRGVDRVIKADANPIHTLKSSYLRLAVGLYKRNEARYAQEQMEWVFGEKIKGCLRRMHLEWDPKLAALDIEIPLDDEAFVALVVSQPGYQTRSQRMTQEERTALGI